MTQRGMVQGAIVLPDGSELAADALSGATSLFVENPTDYSDDSEVEVNGQRVAFTAIDDDSGEISLASGLAAGAAAGTWVYVVAGGQVADNLWLKVSLGGEGDPVMVKVPFGDRDLWPESDEYDDPIPIALTDDLERYVEVPGRKPVRDTAFTTTPRIGGYLGVTESITTATSYAPILWGIDADATIEFDFGSNTVTLPLPGIYDIFLAGSFSPDGIGGVGARQASIEVNTGSGWVEVDVDRRSNNGGSKTTVKSVQKAYYAAGTSVRFRFLQNSGITLTLLNTETRFSIVKIAN